ncbi:sorting nexin 2B-like protein [Tanacetum coccineum]
MTVVEDDAWNSITGFLFHLSQYNLHEYLGAILAVNNAYADLSNALLTTQNLLLQLSNLNSRIEKLEAAASKIFDGHRSRGQGLFEEGWIVMKWKIEVKIGRCREKQRRDFTSSRSEPQTVGNEEAPDGRK